MKAVPLFWIGCVRCRNDINMICRLVNMPRCNYPHIEIRSINHEERKMLPVKPPCLFFRRNNDMPYSSNLLIFLESS